MSAVAGKRHIVGEAVRFRGAVEEPDGAAVREGLRPPSEFLMPAPEIDVPAAWCPAFRFAFGAGVLIAEPIEVTIRAGFQNEDIDLVGGKAEAVFVNQRP